MHGAWEWKLENASNADTLERENIFLINFTMIRIQTIRKYKQKRNPPENNSDDGEKVELATASQTFSLFFF